MFFTILVVSTSFLFDILRLKPVVNLRQARKVRAGYYLLKSPWLLKARVTATKKLMMIFYSFCCLMFLITAHAETVSPENPTLIAQKALIKKISEGHLTILKNFKATEDWQGFVVQASTGKSIILYVNQKATFLFAGSIVSQEGVDLTAQYTEQYIRAEIATQAFMDAEKTEWFQEGQDNAPHKFYAIVDPLCGYCKKQYALLRPLIDRGEIQVRWILVAYLKSDSAGIAANILIGASDKERSVRFAQHEQTNGLTPLQSDSTDLVRSALFAAIGKNTAFFEIYAAHFVGTPTFLFINDAHHHQFYPGMIAEEKLSAVLQHVGASWS